MSGAVGWVWVPLSSARVLTALEVQAVPAVTCLAYRSIGMAAEDPPTILLDEAHTEALPAGLQGRRSRLHLDLAWAQAQARNDLEAILHLQQAERVAPSPSATT